MDSQPHNPNWGCTGGRAPELSSAAACAGGSGRRSQARGSTLTAPPPYDLPARGRPRNVSGSRSAAHNAAADSAVSTLG